MIKLYNYKHFYKRISFGLFASILLIATNFSIKTVTAAELDSKNIATIKQEILNDADFINALKTKLNNGATNGLSESRVKQLVKEYLLENPEMILEVQEALNQKQEKLSESKQASTINSLKKDIFNYPQDAVIGNPNGMITLVEFYDYNCGYCKRAKADVDSLIAKNPDLKIVLKDFAILGEDSVKAHIVAQAFLRLMPEKYAQYHEELLLSEGKATEEKAIKIAVKLGANKSKLQTLMKDKSLQEPLQKTMQIAYALEINGTPTFIIGDKMVVGAVGEAALQQTITELRNK